MKSLAKVVYRNLANVTSLLGVLPLGILLLKGGYQYLPHLIIYNNIMDDLDGILANKLGIKSRFGASLDNVCDAVAHIMIAMVVGAHYGVVPLAVCTLPATAILLRVVSRVDPAATARGTPTNELMRHLLFIVLLEQAYCFNVVPFILAAFALHAVSMLVPYAMPHLIRSQAGSVLTIALVNLALVLAWYDARATAIVGLCFVVTYLYSLVVSGVRWVGSRSGDVPQAG